MSSRGANNIVCLLTMVCAVSLAGCAQIVVQTDEAPPKSELRFGVLSIDIAPSQKNTIVSSSGFGLISNPSGATLGYSKARIVRIGDEWPAPGSEDTKFGVTMGREVGHGEAEVYAGIHGQRSGRIV